MDLTPVVVDTDVVSFLFKAHSLAPVYQAILAGRRLAVSHRNGRTESIRGTLMN
jgi:hypothetical protein